MTQQPDPIDSDNEISFDTDVPEENTLPRMAVIPTYEMESMAEVIQSILRENISERFLYMHFFADLEVLAFRFNRLSGMEYAKLVDVLKNAAKYGEEMLPLHDVLTRLARDHEHEKIAKTAETMEIMFNHFVHDQNNGISQKDFASEMLILLMMLRPTGINAIGGSGAEEKTRALSPSRINTIRVSKSMSLTISPEVDGVNEITLLGGEEDSTCKLKMGGHIFAGRQIMMTKLFGRQMVDPIVLPVDMELEGRNVKCGGLLIRKTAEGIQVDLRGDIHGIRINSEDGLLSNFADEATIHRLVHEAAERALKSE